MTIYEAMMKKNIQKQIMAEQVSMQIIMRLRQIIQEMSKHSKYILENHNITIPQLICLREVHEHGPISIGALTKIVFLSTIQDASTWDDKRSQMLAFEEAFCVGNHSNPLTNWKNAAYYDLLAQALETSDDKARRDLYVQAETILVEEECVLVPLYIRD